MASLPFPVQVAVQGQASQQAPHAGWAGTGAAILARAAGARSNIVGQYEVIKTLGEGAFGLVKLGQHIITGQKVALKCLEKSKINSVMDRKRVKREIRIMQLLDHPNIIKLLDVIELKDEIYLVLEYASGGELFDYIVAHSKVSEREARKFFRQMISGVSYCHSLSIIHRDLKPENLLLDEDRNIRIIDFGFSNQMQKNSLLSTFCGSPAYAAPEMIAGQKYTGPEVDVWSLGVILFALLCGYLPFDHEVLAKLYQKIMKGTYHTPSHVSSGAKHLIARCLTSSPSKRATLAEIRAHPWVNEGYPAPVPAPRPEGPRALNANQIDEALLVQLGEMDFDPTTTRTHLLAGKDSRETGAYFLLVAKKEEDSRRKIREQQAAQSREVAQTLLNRSGGPGAGHSRANRPSSTMVNIPPIAEGPSPASPKVGGEGIVGPPTRPAPAATHRPAAPKTAASKLRDETAASPGSHTRRHSIAGEERSSAIAGSSKRSELVVPSPRDTSELTPTSGPAADPRSPPAGPPTPTATTSTTSSSKAGTTTVSSMRPHPLADSLGPLIGSGSTPNPSPLELMGGPPGPPMPPPTAALGPAGSPARPRRDSMATVTSRVSNPGTRPSTKRRFSLDAAMSSLSNIMRGRRRSSARPDGIRTIKYQGTFSVSTTSSMLPGEIVIELIRVLRANSISLNQTGYTLDCCSESPAVSFEIEICRLEKLAYYGVQLRRVSGDTWAYKTLCETLLSQLHL